MAPGLDAINVAQTNASCPVSQVRFEVRSERQVSAGYEKHSAHVLSPFKSVCLIIFNDGTQYKPSEHHM
jgi:hypothetical protein